VASRGDVVHASDARWISGYIAAHVAWAHHQYPDAVRSFEDLAKVTSGHLLCDIQVPPHCLCR
jgi:hypothetical protein